MAWETQTAPSYEPIPMLLGIWQGAVRTAEGETPLTIIFQTDGSVHVTLDGQATTRLNSVRYEEGLLVGEFAGKSAIESSINNAHTIQLGLRLQHGVLSGYIKSIFSTDAGHFVLPEYVSLTRREARNTDD